MNDALSQLAEFSFAGVSFPVEDSSVDGGHDVAEHSAYLRRGADVEPCGQKPYRVSVTIPFINTPQLVARYGLLFPDLRFDLISAFETQPIAALIHPTFGTFQAAVTEWKEALAPDARGGVRLTATFLEHNGEAGLLVGPEGTPQTPTTAAAQRQATEADALLAQYQFPPSYPLLAVVVASQLAALEGGLLAYSAVSACFRAMLAPVALYLALPALANARAHAATLALLDLQATLYALQSRYQPTLVQSRRFTVPSTMALWQVAHLVYGDASQTALLLAANAIPEPLLVRAGTVLTILPAA